MGDRLVHTEDAELIRHTIYEPGAFVPLLQLQRKKGHPTEAELLMSGMQDDEDQDGMRLEDMPRAQRELLQEVLQMAMQPGGKALQGLPISQEASEMLNESVATLKAAHDASAKAHPVTIRHYLTDHLGTPIALVDANGPRAGQVTWAASYNAWGDVKEEFNPFNLQQLIRFQGQQLDIETGLHYNRFRYYDSSVGGYVTQDPIGFHGGINFYGYVNQPQSIIDPLGLKAETFSGRKAFNSSDAAAADVLKGINKKSIKDNREYGGMICKVECTGPTCGKSEKYISSKPKKGTLAGANPSNSPCQKGTTAVGDYHTHGNYSLKDGTATTPSKDEFDSLHFSPTDISGISSDGVGKPNCTGYLGTPANTFFKYTPATGKTEPLK